MPCIKIYRIRVFFTSWDSASESNNLSSVRKIFTGKFGHSFLRIQPFYGWLSLDVSHDSTVRNDSFWQLNPRTLFKNIFINYFQLFFEIQRFLKISFFLFLDIHFLSELNRVKSTREKTLQAWRHVDLMLFRNLQIEINRTPQRAI